MDLQGIGQLATSKARDDLAPNPAIPHEPKGPDNSPDDSPDLGHLRALAVAADALVRVDPERARELLRALIRLLDVAARHVAGVRYDT